MVKLFGVGQDDSGLQQIELGEEIPVEHTDISSEEVGQIALDVLENHDSVYILAPVAGIELGDIDIAVHETTLSISGVRNKPKEFYEHQMEVRNQECFWGRFLRKVILGDNMDFSQVKAVMENNLLVIHIPKIRFASQHIKINKISG